VVAQHDASSELALFDCMMPRRHGVSLSKLGNSLASEICMDVRAITIRTGNVALAFR
jgi:hypothetical protein